MQAWKWQVALAVVLSVGTVGCGVEKPAAPEESELLGEDASSGSPAPSDSADMAPDAPFAPPPEMPLGIAHAFSFDTEMDMPAYQSFDDADLQMAELGRGGGMAVRVSTTEGGASQWGGIGIGAHSGAAQEEMLEVTPMAPYKGSVWVRGIENYEGVAVQMHVRGKDGSHMVNNMIELNGDWQELTVDFVPKEDMDAVSVHVGKRRAPQPAVYLIDDLSIQPRSR